MKAEEYLDIQGWVNPDFNFEADLIDIMEKYANQRVIEELEGINNRSVDISLGEYIPQHYVENRIKELKTK